MKSETEIAEENIEDFKRHMRNNEMMNLCRMACAEHKASCQRFLEFLKAMKGRQQRWLTYQLIPLSKKMVDLENTIKKYDEVGI